MIAFNTFLPLQDLCYMLLLSVKNVRDVGDASCPYVPGWGVDADALRDKLIPSINEGSTGWGISDKINLGWIQSGGVMNDMTL